MSARATWAGFPGPLISSSAFGRGAIEHMQGGTLDLALRSDRLRAYELVLREGTPSDIEAIVDGVLLCEAWPDLTLPRSLRAAWNALIAEQREPTDLAAAS